MFLLDLYRFIDIKRMKINKGVARSNLSVQISFSTLENRFFNFQEKI